MFNRYRVSDLQDGKILETSSQCELCLILLNGTVMLHYVYFITITNKAKHTVLSISQCDGDTNNSCPACGAQSPVYQRKKNYSRCSPSPTWSTTFCLHVLSFSERFQAWGAEVLQNNSPLINHPLCLKSKRTQHKQKAGNGA